MSNIHLLSVVPAISLLIVVFGWFINNWLNRRHEVAKKRTELRMELLKSFIHISKQLNFRQSEFSAEKMLDVQIDFLTFGYDDEIELINNLVISINEKQLEIASKHLTNLSKLVRARLRKELGLPQITSPLVE